MPTAAFASKTERTSQNLKHAMNPGPGNKKTNHYFLVSILSRPTILYKFVRIVTLTCAVSWFWSHMLIYTSLNK